MPRCCWFLFIAAGWGCVSRPADPEALVPVDDSLPPAPAEAAWVELFDGQGLGQWEVTRFGGEGEVRVQDGALRLPFGSMLTGVHWGGEPLPAEYEVEVVSARISGSDFFCGLTLPVGEDFASVILGGWGGALTGLSCVDGQDASDNGTRGLHAFETGRDYSLRVRVDRSHVRGWLDGEPLFEQPRAGHSFSLRPEVLPSKPFGVASFATTARVSALRMRPLLPAPNPQD